MTIPSLHDIQRNAGAVFEAGCEVPLRYGNNSVAITAARNGVAVCDRSHWGLIQLSGADRLRYLHNQTTNTLQTRQPGEGCETVFVTSTARTMDLATAYCLEEHLWVLVSPQCRQPLMKWLDRYLFPMDQVTLTDLSPDYSIFSLMGPESDAIMEKLGAADAVKQALHHHQLRELNGVGVRVAQGSGLSDQGYTLIVPTSEAQQLWQMLMDLDVVPLGEQVWQHLRILHGRPEPDAELTEDYNPLEAGLWQTISFDKGCYIGQETIARLNTYKGVKQYLWGLRLSAAVSPGTPITVEGNKIGILTSYTEMEQPPFGLGYVRVKAGGAGLTVQVGEATAEVVEVPFLTHVSMAK